jgi:hypothetical protein
MRWQVIIKNLGWCVPKHTATTTLENGEEKREKLLDN